MDPKITAALISAAISTIVALSIAIVSRFVFSRNDRRFAVMVLIQEELLKLQRNPPWDTNGGGLHLHKISEYVSHVDPYFRRLRMVSFPKRDCPAHQAWRKLVNFDEEKWRRETTGAQDFVDIMTKEEFIREIDKVLDNLM
jgi:hypothetical protein